MAETTHISETLISEWPAVDGLSSEAAALDPAPIWTRIEYHIAWRWPARSVVWDVSGPGEWIPSIAESEIDEVLIWRDTSWQPITPDPAPRGIVLPEGRFKISGTAGSDDVAPAAVLEAFRRLAEYLAASDTSAPGASRFSTGIGPISETFSQSPSHIARALVNSGAADLLRPYRRA